MSTTIFLRIARLALPLAAVVIIAGVDTPAHAQGADMSRAKCSDYNGLSSMDQLQISLWLAGYYAGSAQRPTLDPAGLPDVTKTLIELCTKTPDVPLIGAETRPLYLSAPKQ